MIWARPGPVVATSGPGLGQLRQNGALKDVGHALTDLAHMMPDLGRIWQTESGPDLVMMWPGPGQTWARHGPCPVGPWPHDAIRMWARSGPDVTNIIRSRHGPNVARSGPGLGQMWQNECGPGLVLMWPTMARSGPVPAVWCT